MNVVNTNTDSTYMKVLSASVNNDNCNRNKVQYTHDNCNVFNTLSFSNNLNNELFRSTMPVGMVGFIIQLVLAFSTDD